MTIRPWCRSSAMGRDQIELPDALLSMASQAKELNSLHKRGWVESEKSQTNKQCIKQGWNDTHTYIYIYIHLYMYILILYTKNRMFDIWWFGNTIKSRLLLQGPGSKMKETPRWQVTSWIHWTHLKFNSNLKMMGFPWVSVSSESPGNLGLKITRFHVKLQGSHPIVWGASWKSWIHKELRTPGQIWRAQNGKSSRVRP